MARARGGYRSNYLLKGQGKVERLAKALRSSKRKYNPTKALTAAVKPTKTFAAMVDKVLDKQRETKRGTENLMTIAEQAAAGQNGNMVLQIAAAADNDYACRAWNIYPRGSYQNLVANGSNTILNNRLCLQSAKLSFRLKMFCREPQNAEALINTTEYANVPCLVRYAIIMVNKNLQEVTDGVDPNDLRGDLDTDASRILSRLVFFRPNRAAGTDQANMSYNDQHFLEWSPQKQATEYKDAWNVSTPFRVLKYGHRWLRAHPGATDPASAVGAFYKTSNKMMTNTHQFTKNSESGSFGTGLSAGTTAVTGVTRDTAADEAVIRMDITQCYGNGGILEWESGFTANSEASWPMQATPILVMFQRPDEFDNPGAPWSYGQNKLRTCVQTSVAYEWQD